MNSQNDRRDAAAAVFRPMTMRDLPAVLAIIEDHDEDDAEEAEESLTARNCDRMFVIEEAGRILGVTGTTVDDAAPEIRWLSWTYLREDARGQGHATHMFHDLLRKLSDENVRKLFIATSDYREDGEDIYADARAFYEAEGAKEELRVPHYHDTDESRIIYALENPGASGGSMSLEAPGGIVFEGIGAASESEGGYGLIWRETESGVSGLDEQVEAAARTGARALFAELPEDLSGVAAPALTGAGFRQVGVLTDYYARYLGQVIWMRLSR